MNCCDFNPMVTLSEQGKEITTKLKIWAFIYFGFTVTKVLLFGVGNIFNDLLTFLLVVLTFVQLSYCMAIFAMFFLCFQMLFDFITIALLAQDYLLSLVKVNPITFALLGTSLLISIALVYYTFQAYREYKALYIEQAGGGGGYNRLNDNDSNANANANRLEMNNMPSEGASKQFVPFSGQGATWE